MNSSGEIAILNAMIATFMAADSGTGSLRMVCSYDLTEGEQCACFGHSRLAARLLLECLSHLRLCSALNHQWLAPRQSYRRRNNCRVAPIRPIIRTREYQRTMLRVGGSLSASLLCSGYRAHISKQFRPVYRTSTFLSDEESRSSAA